jgi:hypothetical protein
MKKPTDVLQAKGKNMKVWILSYSHAHGTDISVYRTEEKAGAGAIESMEQWFDDLEDRFFLSTGIRRKIRRTMNQGDYRKAIDLWNGHTDETFEIEEKAVE